MSDWTKTAAQPQGGNKALLLEWDQAKSALEAAKLKEKELRARVIASFFPNPVRGTNSYALAQGHRLVYQHKIDYNLVVPDNYPHVGDRKATVLELAADIEQRFRMHGNVAAFVVEDLIKKKVELSTTQYLKLDDGLRKLIDPFVVSKPGSPTLEIKEGSSK